MFVEKLVVYIRKGEEPRVPHHASAAASRNGNLPYVTATCLT